MSGLPRQATEKGNTCGNRRRAEHCRVLRLFSGTRIDIIDTLELTEMQHMIGDRILKEIVDRLGFLRSVGLEYLTLSRASGTLSGGESQRIRLATQIGSSLMGVLYILDEPSIGLHQRDNDKLIAMASFSNLAFFSSKAFFSSSVYSISRPSFVIHLSGLDSTSLKDETIYSSIEYSKKITSKFFF